jgi:hypothetical protein
MTYKKNNKLTTTLQYKSIQMYCDNLLSNITEEEIKIACELVNNIKTNLIELIWNKRKEKFVF